MICCHNRPLFALAWRQGVAGAFISFWREVLRGFEQAFLQPIRSFLRPAALTALLCRMEAHKAIAAPFFIALGL